MTEQQVHWANKRTTTARGHLADAIVARIGHEHVAVRINNDAIGIEEAGVGAGRVGERNIGATDPARQR